MLLTWKRRSLATLSRWSAKDLCGRLDEPGEGTDNLALVDYSGTTATPDQRRIEEVLAKRDLSGARILHVGVGDSGLASRLLGRCGRIDGITVSESERLHAESLNLPGYRVFRLNKYARELASLEPGYAVIVDNNPASFACCAYHFAGMLDNYRRALACGGEMLTDERGLRWVAGHRGWKMTFGDLEAAGLRFGLKATRVTEAVYSLRRD